MNQYRSLTEKMSNSVMKEAGNNSKDLSIALSIETSELNELFLWKGAEDVNTEKLKEELADVFIYGLLIANNHNLDINEIVSSKLEINEKKYPIEKSKNNPDKYNKIADKIIIEAKRFWKKKNKLLP